MSIFESLENLNVSEECFDDIMGIVEEIINELENKTVGSMYKKRQEAEKRADDKVHYADTFGETALKKARAQGDKEEAKKIKKFIDNAHNEQATATSKKLKAQKSIKNWARKMRNTNVGFDDKGNGYVEA